MAVDNWVGKDADDPPRRSQDVVLDTEFAFVARGIYVGVGGNIRIKYDYNGTEYTQTFPAVPQGTVLLHFCKEVTTTGTTASSLVALE